MELKLKEPIDNLCDYTYNFAWQDNKIHPTDIIPSQEDTSFTYKELVNELKKGKDVRIYGNVGKRLAYSLGANLVHFGGNGAPEKAGKIYIDGNVSSEMGMGMVSGAIYRKFRSITEILCKGLGKDVPVKNNFDERKKHLILDDGKLRGQWQHDVIVMLLSQ